jgi:cobalt-zinc-cadmium efflux system outer membrane protein
MRRSTLRAALAIALVSSSAGAQSLTLTESEALARISPDSPHIRAIRAEVDVARVDVVAAGRWPTPRSTVTRESVAGVTEYLAMVSQPLPITGLRGLEVEAASARVAASSGRVDDQIRRVKADLRVAFAGLLSAQRKERELATAVDRLRVLTDVLSTREAAGAAAGFDRLRAEQELLDLEMDGVLAATDRARYQAVLSSFFDDSVEATRIVAVDESTAPVPVPPLPELLEMAESSRGGLVALTHEIDAAGLAGRAADRRLVPVPEIVAGTKSSSVSGAGMGTVVSVNVSLPFFARARPERALAVAREAQARARRDAFRRALQGQIAALRVTVVERRAAAARYRAEGVTGADEVERIAQISYDAGERSILELLDAYRLGSTARLRLAALDASVRQAEIELAFVSGWERAR